MVLMSSRGSLPGADECLQVEGFGRCGLGPLGQQQVQVLCQVGLQVQGLGPRIQVEQECSGCHHFLFP